MEQLTPEILRFIRYCSFKMDCLREQEANPLVVDLEKAQRHYNELEALKQEKTEALAKVMPKIPVCSYRSKPKVLYKKDGSLSALAEKWYQLLKEQHLPSTTEGVVTIVEGYEDGNPNSPSQVKEWLYSLGWKPCTYKYDRNKKTGEEKKIEQVRYSSPSDPRKGMLTDSVLKLKAKEPGIEHLEGLTVASHRMSIFKSLLDSAKPIECEYCDGMGQFLDEGACDGEMAAVGCPSGWCLKCNATGNDPRYGHVVAGAGGFTNTLRLKHRAPIVNLPKVGSAWGEEIRGCIVAPEGMTVCGADVVSLESSTKKHFMWDYDPAYVTEMSADGFDEHLDLAKHAGEVTQEQIDLYNQGKAPELKAVRNVFKPANYAGVYGVKELTLSRSTGMSVQRCKELIEAYWERNWSVKEIAKAQFVKTLKDGSMWLKNPISGFYYSLRYQKDIFSTLNQGTGVFIFDSWVMRCRKKGVVFSLQYHDEHLSYPKIGNEHRQTELLQEAMREVNETLKLNVEITSDIQYGPSYSHVH